MSNRSRPRIWLRHTLLASLALLLVGFTYQQIGESRDLRRFPPPGTLVDIGTARIHLDCKGTGSPTVLLEAGAGGSSLSWHSVHAELARATRTCAYDRSGFGWSSLQPAAPTQEQVLDNLVATLANARIQGPFVLVGHSLGGVYVRDFAYWYPSEVVGIVLVDSSHENQIARMPSELLAQQTNSTAWIRRATSACRFATAVGLVRATRLWSFLSPAMPDDVRGPFIAARNRASFCPAMNSELAQFTATLAQSAAPRDLGDTPLIVLSHGKNNPTSAAEREWEETWANLQKDLAALSRNSKRIVVDNAGHAIQIDRPDAVIDAVVELVRRPAPLR